MSSAGDGDRLYGALVRLGVPLRRWIRLEATGSEIVPPPGTAVLVVSNHDSMLDPLALADTLFRAGRPLRFLTMSRLWRSRVLGTLLDGVGQIPIRRGRGDAEAMQAATAALAAGEAVCIFPEGQLSRGRRLRAHTGVARLIEAAPGAEVILAAVSGGTDLARFPRRPLVRVELSRPRTDLTGAAADRERVAGALLEEVRARVPPVAAGRRAMSEDRRPA